jgi:preprotein translocase subunit YajC
MILNSLLFLAQAATPAVEGTPQQPGFLVQMLPLVFIFVIFYFMLIRPQQKRQKEHQKLVSSVKSGDRVVTNAGIHGIVANVKDKTIIIKVADNVKLEFDRGAIATVKASADEPEETKA